MVSSVSSTPYSYLGQPAGATAAIAPAPATPTGSGSGNTTASSLVSSLLSGSSSGSYSSEILSLLQENGSGSFDPVTSLLGGTSTSNGLTSIYSSLFSSSLAATLQQAQANGKAQVVAAASTTAADPVTGLINSYTQASISYNNTLQQNAQAVLTNNSYNA